MLQSNTQHRESNQMDSDGQHLMIMLPCILVLVPSANKDLLWTMRCSIQSCRLLDGLCTWFNILRMAIRTLKN